ncbi:metal-dependent hydrolase [Paraburkholderia dilworthii]|uniref:metal-dependent hydrolase n=1 Tax=Paraburkholderia dilworthii TaxID=948106 RepID=UPI0003FDC061|nr:metal-dependent hydrolase [Paraburkholderia dilworthii]
MASSKAHHATGFAAGVIAAAVVARIGGGSHGGAFYVGVLMSFVAGVGGSTAPDWLEVAWWSGSRRLWIAHRTLTHWGIGWIALLAVSYRELGHSVYAAPAFGFGCGGLMHLLADWPNPLGVPWIARRHSLNLWNSGHCDLIVVAASWAAAWFVGRHMGLPDIHGLDLLQQLRL